MRVLVVNTNRNGLPVPVIPGGACIVAEAAARAGHDARLLDLMFSKDPGRTLRRVMEDFKPEVTGFSVRNIDNNDMQHPATFIKEVAPLIKGAREQADGKPFVLGGPAVALMPEEILRATGARFAVLGDGDTVFPGVLERISRGQDMSGLPGTAYFEEASGAFIKNPCAMVSSDSCMAPDYKRWIDVKRYMRHSATIPIQTKLGCHFNCVYCTYRKLEGSAYRLFSPQSVAEAVRRYASEGLRDIEFTDNVFNSPPEHAMAVCEELIKKNGAGAPRRARLQSLELNPLYLDDDLVYAMQKAGFVGLGITVESASAQVLAGLRKGFTAEDVRRAAGVVHRHELPCFWIFMMGGPGETKETVMETIRFAERSVRKKDAAIFSVGIRIYPGTGLEALAREQGVLSITGDAMLEPVFYFSPLVEYGWTLGKLRESMRTHLNFVTLDALGISSVGFMYGFTHAIGMRPPLWRYTRSVRRLLRLLGKETV